MPVQSQQAYYLYEALFDWQSPLSLWQKSDDLKTLLGDEALSGRDAGKMEIKRILEGWVIGKSLYSIYPDAACLVRVSQAPSLDGQLYHNRRVNGVEVTQALYSCRKRNIFGRACGGTMPPAPLQRHEEESYARYFEQFVRQAFMQVEARIEHKFQLYPHLDYLLVYVDLFDAAYPRYSYYALQDFYEEYGRDLEARLALRFRTRWSAKIGHLLLLDDRPNGFVTRVPLENYAELSLA